MPTTVRTAEERAAARHARQKSHPLTPSTTQGAENVRRIFLLRNGQSVANVDIGEYVRTPDWRIGLTPRGEAEAREAGERLADVLGNEPVVVYFSPYVRSKETLRLLLLGAAASKANSGAPGGSASGAEALHAAATPPPDVVGASRAVGRAVGLSRLNIVGVREDVRLRDGDIGRYASKDELLRCFAERERYGKFFYRFPHGESAADVCDRVTSFLDAFQREKASFPPDTNVVILTHGLTIRMWVKRLFNLTVETSDAMASPPTGQAVELTRLANNNFMLSARSRVMMHLPDSLTERNGYAYRNKQLLGSLSIGAPYM